MKKIIALLMVCGFAFAVVACGGKTENAESADSTATETPTVAPADTTAADTTAADTTAAAQ
jgi:hypothetical protein